MLNVNIYTNGTVLVQSATEASLDTFQKHFPALKEEANKEKCPITLPVEGEDSDPEEAPPSTAPNMPCDAPHRPPKVTPNT